VLAEQNVLGWGKLLFGPAVRALGNSLSQSEPPSGTLAAPQRGPAGSSLNQSESPSRWWAPLYSLALLAVTFLSVVGARRLKSESILLVVLILYFVALAGGPGSNSRFRVPVTPMLAVLAVAGLCGPEKKR
jgi:asparagine N-glycosylation enzyme membrane subunit Stt3